MTQNISVDPEALRADVRDKYKDVATNPQGTFHFHTGRSPRCSATTQQSLMRCPIGPSSRSQASATPTRSGHPARVTTSSTSARAESSAASSPLKQSVPKAR